MDVFKCNMDSCDSSIDWATSTSYWLGSARNCSTMWYISSDNSLYFLEYNDDYNCGIRPVITIDKSEIKKYLQ